MDQLFTATGFDDPGSGPLYLQLQRRIAEAIASGRLSPGSSLPAERDMAAMTGLSRVTIRNAIQALVASGQLVQRRGSGTFVAQKVERLEQALSLLTSFTEDMSRRGKSVDSQWISRMIGAPAPEEVMALGLGADEHVVRLERVRRSDGLPLAIERASLPTTVLPDPGLVEGSLYLTLDTLGMRPVRAVQRISAANLGPRDAELLGVSPGVAGLRIERIGYLATGRVVEFTRSLYRGDAYDFAVELKLAPEGQAK
ncbi:GntR family transcriptional regulator [Xinfangfangia sp. CPCC 101601]|uniref:GntR family transcriptional regulator n=1 Tax=Pseudogemmobacter lacusdianii TaxID=3069608 RepID=A0ABU0VU61_9RHOB|nr:GntR family transcriptional regulator [Xinfangfangia sp. CPCC 101601]MDQ2065272.1 GntR family transcriptional regulator [Xinfangfangia sp. CPCC 101601]